MRRHGEYSEVTTIRFDMATKSFLDMLAIEREKSRAEIIRSIISRYKDAYRIDWQELALDKHLCIVAPTLHGKSFLVQNHIIPELGKRTVVIDVHREYSFKQYVVSYGESIPPINNQLFEVLQLQRIWNDTDRIVEALLEELDNHENLCIIPDILDPTAEKVVISEFLKRITQRKWGDLLLVVEEANKYDCRSLVSRGRHAEIQAVLISQYFPDWETVGNCRVVLGPLSPSLVEEYDPLASQAVMGLGRGEFIWELKRGTWKKYRYEDEKTAIQAETASGTGSEIGEINCETSRVRQVVSG